MVGILVSFWDCQFSGAMLVSGNVIILQHFSKIKDTQTNVTPTHSTSDGTLDITLHHNSLRIMTRLWFPRNLFFPNKQSNAWCMIRTERPVNAGFSPPRVQGHPGMYLVVLVVDQSNTRRNSQFFIASVLVSKAFFKTT